MGAIDCVELLELGVDINFASRIGSADEGVYLGVRTQVEKSCRFVSVVGGCWRLNVGAGLPLRLTNCGPVAYYPAMTALFS